MTTPIIHPINEKKPEWPHMAKLRAIIERIGAGISAEDASKQVNALFAKHPVIPPEVTPEQGKIWCAACGKMGDHGSGTCPTIRHPITPPPASGPSPAALEVALEIIDKRDTFCIGKSKAYFGAEEAAAIIDRKFPRQEDGARLALKYVRHEFVARMDAELIANERKGDWDAFRPKRFDTCAWMTEHTNKLWDALREHDRVKVSEYCADIANIAMKIDVTFGAKQEDIDSARAALQDSREPKP